MKGTGWAVSALALAFLFHRLGEPGSEALTALMGVVCILQTLVLLWRRTVFGSFLLILFSSVHAAGTAFHYKDPIALFGIALYVAVLVWTLLLFERRAAQDEENRESSARTRRIRASGAATPPLRAALATVLWILLLGFPVGVLLYLAMPRDLFPTPNLHGRQETGEGDTFLTDEGTRGKGLGLEGISEGVAVTGPGGKGVRLGSVAEIKKDFTPWFEVSLEASQHLPPTVVLRDNTQDHYSADGTWRDTISVPGRSRVYRDSDDRRMAGWVDLSFPDRPDGLLLRITLQRGGHKRLYLQPNPVRLRLLRGGVVQGSYRVLESRGETFEVEFPLQAGDVILQRCVPWIHEQRDLVGRRSDSAVSPLVNYLQLPDACRGPLERRARQVVGTESDPWLRARKLEAWLKSEAFTYTLSIPAVDRSNPIVDFLERTRRANCEYFASALTLMLRALGHPARYVRGFWGGDKQEQRGSYLLRGYHYHAWTEMYLDRAGWIPLNPTPPDRYPADAATFTAAAKGDLGAPSAAPFSFLGYDGAQRARFWSGVGAFLSAALVRPCGRLFGPKHGFIGVPLLILLLWILRRRRRHAHLKRLVVVPGGHLPPGPYGQALLALARKGIRRPPSWTPREFARLTGRRLPQVREPLEALTHLFEAERYGGMYASARPAAGLQSLAALRKALKQSAGPMMGR